MTSNLAFRTALRRMAEKDRLLEQATTCRRLANSINDPETAERLRALAEECERRAAELQSPEAPKDE